MPKIAFSQNFSQDLLCNFELEIWPKCSFLGTLRNQSIGWDMRRRFKYYGSYKTSIQGFLMAPWNYRSIKKCWCPHPYWNSEFNPSKKDVPTTNRGWRLGTWDGPWALSWALGSWDDPRRWSVPWVLRWKLCLWSESLTLNCQCVSQKSSNYFHSRAQGLL